MAAILVAVDLSEASGRTLQFAAEIAVAKGVMVDVVHVLVSSVPATAKVHAPPAIREKINSTEDTEALMALETLMQEHVPGVARGEFRLTHGDPAKTVCEEAKKGYAMVVVSTHGRKGLEHVMLGSVAERIVRYATIPVLVVR